MNKKINRLPNSENSFKRAILLGFIISFGLIFVIHPLETTTFGIIFQLTIGTGFMGVVFNVLIMCLTSIFLFLFPLKLASKYSRENLFYLVMQAHLPLILGIIIVILRLLNTEISSTIVFGILELTSLLLLVKNLRQGVQ